MPGQRRDDCITICIAARRAHLSPRTVRRYIRRGLVNELLTEADMAELRRIRRLTDIGINLASVEIILRMRRQIEDLQAEMARLETLLASLGLAFLGDDER